MEITLEQYQQVERYFDGEMDAAEKAQFLLEVNDNAVLREAFDLENQLRNNSLLAEEIQIRAMVQSASEEWEKEKAQTSPMSGNVIKIKYFKRIAIAAIFIGVVFGAAIIIPYFRDEPVTHQKSEMLSINDEKLKEHQLAEEQIRLQREYSLKEMERQAEIENSIRDSIEEEKAKEEIASLSSILKKGDELPMTIPIKKSIHGKEIFADLYKKYYKKDELSNDEPSDLALLGKEYIAGKYANILKLDIDKLQNARGNAEENSRNKETAHYYKGIANIEKNYLQKADKELQWVIDSSANNLLKQKAAWYQAMVNLKTGDNKKVREILKIIISDTGSKYNSEAKKILSELENKNTKR